METYYDISKQDRFDLFYKDVYVHQHPTNEKNSYLILKFNFSAVDPHPRKLESSFLNNVQTIVKSFLYKYTDYLVASAREELNNGINGMKSSADILLKTTNLCALSNRKLYIIIDEYDNFANTILSTSGSEAYKDLTHGEGFFRAFFNVLKEGTTGSGAPISRMFITGVSPITLDDVTSGFNIGKNFSMEPEFNEMLGFTEDDALRMIEYYRQYGLLVYESRYLLDIMNEWYDNYIFSKKSKTTVYNSDMALYFIDKCIRSHDIPDQLIDRNVRIDYGKLRHLMVIDSDRQKLTNGNFSRLKQIDRKSVV
jgi:hypothetical protein